MKKLIALFLAVLLLSGCAATYDGPTEEIPRMTEYTVTHYYSFFDWEEEHYTNRTLYAYDIYGNRVREMEYRDNELIRVTNRKYDDQGREISRTQWDHSGWFPKFDSRTEQTYDDQGRLLSTVYSDFWGRQESCSRYTYDDEARTRTWTDDSGNTQVTWFDENGNELRQVSDLYETVYQYDPNGNLLGWVSYENGVPADRYEARYDDQNRQIWGGRYDAAGTLLSQTEYTYDEALHTRTTLRPDGQTRIEYYHPDGRPHMCEDYDPEGRLTLLQQYYYQDIKVPAKEE